MQVHPTRAAFHVAVAGAGLTTLGAAARLAPVVAFGGAMLLAVAIGRAVAIVAVTRLRRSGFEMVWRGTSRVHRVASGASLVLQGELRNRGGDSVLAVEIRPIASSMLEASAEPRAVELPSGARTRIDITVRAKRVGRWGLYGLALEVRGLSLGGESLYEVPLLFANPLGLEVLPARLAALLDSPLGGRARRTSEVGRPASLPGEGNELRELRDHSPGDPFKRIAWKASARRGRLLVREMERDERDVVWLAVDASVELWAGLPGSAPLDRVVEDVAALATRHLRRGDLVGLVVTASRLRSWIAPAGGAAHGAVLARALASASSTVDADRSALDEAGIARLVAEHARPMDPRGLAGVAAGDRDALAERADELRRRAPFAPRVPFASTGREESLRHYLSAFGVESPPRLEGERAGAEVMLGQTLRRLVIEKPRASVIHVWAPPPATADAMARAIAGARRRRIALRWSLPPFEAGVGAEPGRRSAVAQAVDDAVRARARAAHTRGEKLLRRLGFRVIAGSELRVGPRETEVQEKTTP